MDDAISKTQKKKEAQALQDLGVELAQLSPERLKLLPLSDGLRDAIGALQDLKSHGAHRRQAQRIGKLMRSDNVDAIKEAYELMLTERKGQTAAFHDVEHWRTRLMEEGKDALTAFIDQFQPQDIQTLKHLIQKAVSEHTQNKPKGAAKALFRHLRTIVS